MRGNQESIQLSGAYGQDKQAEEKNKETDGRPGQIGQMKERGECKVEPLLPRVNQS